MLKFLFGCLLFPLLLFSLTFPATAGARPEEIPRPEDYQRIDQVLQKKPAVYRPTDFTIHRFHSAIVIQEKASLSVKETLEVEFHRPRHGIFREIPFLYVDELGRSIQTPIRVLSVENGNGASWEYQLKKEFNRIHIRIGDAKKFVQGRQTYIITYNVENALLFFDSYDELYWNVTGNEWGAPIREVEAEVVPAFKSKSKELRAACYTGFPGSKNSDCTFQARENSIIFYGRRELAPGHGLTIAYSWDKGLVAPPSAWQRLWWTLEPRENWVFLIPIFFIPFLIFHWYTRGRDPKVKEAVAVKYEPPRYQGRFLTPAEVGTLLDEKLDSRDITSTIVALAAKGYLQIEERKIEGWLFDSSDYFLSKIKEADVELVPFETLLLDRLFSERPQGVLVSTLKNEFYKNLNALKSSLYGELVRKGYFPSSPEKVRNRYLLAAALVAGLGIVGSDYLGNPIKTLIAFFLTGVPLLAFSWIMPAKTRSGASAQVEVLGFQEFLNRAEKDRIERLGEKDLFYKYLPYAIALDVVDQWARAFEGVYQEPPNWYSSPGGIRSFSTTGFSRSLGSAVSSMANAMYSSPRGSGSGGGGSSGGGSGGGGGGSW